MERTNLPFVRMSFEEVETRTSLVEIETGDVHVHGFLLDIGEAELGSASRVLSNEERWRGDRLVSESQRRQFIAAHAGLRIILSRYCGNQPSDLVIERAPKGKPFLPQYPAIQFNLTHSHGRSLVAVAKGREVGIDLEPVRQQVDVTSLARRFLSERDVVFIESGESGQRHERFLQAWVAREAVFKAAGTGMTFPLHCDHFEPGHGGTDGQLILGDGKADGAIRPIRFLALEPGWVGGVAAEGTDWRVKYFG